MNNYFKQFFVSDFLASIVVFLVALPLCMGIAIASGVPPILGLISGIIGGLVVGAMTGAPMQVSGPAAGLAVMVYEFIDKFGMESLVPLGFVVGVVQISIYKFKLADYFRAISPALIKGLLGGIGLLIIASQLHVAMDSNPVGGGLKNLTEFPRIFTNLVLNESTGLVPFLLTIATLFAIIIWSKYAGKLSAIIPGPLFGILLISTSAGLANLGVKFIELPENIIDELNFVQLSYFDNFGFSMLISAVAIAFVASAETLLSVSATDKMAGKGNSNYNKEMLAQGLGNSIAGMFGALPITGVIVRSSANIASGAKTKGSAIMHGIWLFAFVFMFSNLLALIPISALAGILLFTGWKLLDPMSIGKIIKKSRSEALIYFTTLSLIVGVDLLTGVVVGFVVSLMALTYKLIGLEITHDESEEEMKITLKGTASFLHVPKISNALKQADSKKKVVLSLDSLEYLDWAVEEQLSSWKEINTKQGRDTTIVHNNTIQ